MRTDVKVGLFLGIAALLLAGWFYWPQAVNRTVPVGETGRPVGGSSGIADRAGTPRPTPSVESLPPIVRPETTVGRTPVPVLVPPPPVAAPAVTPTPTPEPAVASAAPTPAAPAPTPSADAASPVPSPAPAVAAASVGPATVGREPLTHVVRKGETLEQIAEFYYKDGDAPFDSIAMVGLLRQANPQLASGKRLRAGSRIKVPDPASPLVTPAAAPVAPAGETSTPVVPSLATVTAPVVVPAVGSPSTQGAPSLSSREYKVQRGDTLYSIAARQLGNSRRWQEVLNLNSLVLGGKPQGLKPGQVLRLPG